MWLTISSLLHFSSHSRVPRPPLQNRHAPPFQPVAQLPRPCGHEIRRISNLPQRPLQNLTSPHLLLLILPNGQGWDQLLTPAAADEQEILLADLHTHLFLRVVELAYPPSFRKGRQRELRRVRAREVDDVEPGDLWRAGVVSVGSERKGGGFGMRGDDLGWGVEAAFEALDQDWTERSGAEVAGERFVPVEHVGVVRQDGEDVGEGVIFADERQVFCALSREVVDLELVVGAVAVAITGAAALGFGRRRSGGGGGGGGIGRGGAAFPLQGVRGGRGLRHDRCYCVVDMETGRCSVSRRERSARPQRGRGRQLG